MRVLVVEDEQTVRSVVCDILHGLGCDCVCAETDQQAYEAIMTAAPLAGLAVDINLGRGTTGYDVAPFARQAMPNIPVIFMSGQSTQASFRAFGIPGSEYLAKPFTSADLAAAVQRQMPRQT